MASPFWASARPTRCKPHATISSMPDRNDSRSTSARLSAVARQPRGSRRTGAGSTLIGVFIGVVLGLAIAAGVAFYLMRGGSPYQAGAGAAKDPARDSAIARSGKADKDTGRPKFDFYKILPSGEDPKV